MRLSLVGRVRSRLDVRADARELRTSPSGSCSYRSPPGRNRRRRFVAFVGYGTPCGTDASRHMGRAADNFRVHPPAVPYPEPPFGSSLAGSRGTIHVPCAA
jgi:hypothetical protein